MEHILDDIIFDNNPVVVGVSSGPDSMCLLNLLEQITNKLVVCHINHNVRKESTTEEEYLKDYCQKHNLIFESMKITEYKETNFENEARKKRYNFYEEILSKYHSTKLFLAHHGDDQIETILMKIVRGSNLEGYAGIKEISKVKNYQIIRPLLPQSQKQLLPMMTTVREACLSIPRAVQFLLTQIPLPHSRLTKAQHQPPKLLHLIQKQRQLPQQLPQIQKLQQLPQLQQTQSLMKLQQLHQLRAEILQRLSPLSQLR